MNPGAGYPAYSLSRGAPSATWVLLHRPVKNWRRERDSNPRCLSASLVFKTSAFNRSAISPSEPAESFYHILHICQCTSAAFGIFSVRGRAQSAEHTFSH